MPPCDRFGYSPGDFDLDWEDLKIDERDRELFGEQRQ